MTKSQSTPAPTAKPTVANIYYRTYDHTVYALNPTTGDVRWTFNKGQGLNTPIAAGNLVYVQTLGQPDTLTLYALDSATGSVVWSAPVGTPPQVANGCVYTIVTQGLECLEATTGKVHWQQPAQNKGWLKLIGDSIFVGNTVGGTIDATGRQDITSSTLTVRSTTDGIARWSFTREHVQFTSPDVRNGVVYFEAIARPDSSPPTGQIYALKATDGSQLWSAPAPGLANAFAVTDSVYFAGGSATGISAFRTSDGALMWKNTDYLLSRFTAVGNAIYINSFHNSVLALNTTTGDRLWEAQITGPGYAPLVAHGLVYVSAGRGAGKLVAINASTGAISWQVDIQGTPGPPLLTSGMVYTYSILPDNGPSPAVYAFNATTGARMWTHETGQNLETTLAAPDALTGA